MMVYVQVSQVGGKQITHLSNNGFIVSLRCTEQNMEKRDNTNYSYKLLTTFKIVLVPEVVYSSLSMMRKVAYATDIN